MNIQCGKILGFIGNDAVLCVEDNNHKGQCRVASKLMMAAIEWLPRKVKDLRVPWELK